MHMSDSLISPIVAGVGAAVAVTLIAVAIRRTSREAGDKMIPMMGVMGAFIFAAQMLNFTIPGTGSSGHIVGGILLASVLGPWAAFLVLSSVLLLQALLFADGGILVLGCNIINMAAASCLIGYPFITRPLLAGRRTFGRVMWASVAGSVVALFIGAVGVSLETTLSGISALPTAAFLRYMIPIHLVIGAIEGVATGMVLWFLSWRRPALLHNADLDKQKGTSIIWITLAVCSLAMAALFTVIASSSPDGLEWSIVRTSGVEEIVAPTTSATHRFVGAVQEQTALIPDYGLSSAGLIGCAILLILSFLISLMFRRRSAKVNK